jgi:long-subunit fatty acid transport protein
LSKACRPLRCSLAAGLALLALSLTPAAHAQLQINSSPSKVGSGARALGMGSAFIAVADDATASSWNPGGLTQLERPELSLVYSWKRFGEDYESGIYRGMNTDNGVNLDDLNYASFVYPLPQTIGGRNLVFSLNYQRQFDFDRELSFDLDYLSTLPGIIQGTRFIGDYVQEGSLSTFSPAAAIEITNELSVGLAVNFWDQSLISGNRWSSRQEGAALASTNGRVGLGSFGYYRVSDEHENFKGTNFTLGVLWKPNARLSFGAVYNSEFTAETDYMRAFRTTAGGVPIFLQETHIDREITFPASLGAGVAYRFPGDRLTLSFDVTRTEWDDFVINDKRGWRRTPFGTMPFFPRPRRTSAISGLAKELSPHDPTYTLRLGAEYVFVDKTKAVQNILPSVRAGVFYDPEPASNREDLWWGVVPGFNIEGKGDGSPDAFYGFALGAGVLLFDRVNLDIAYQYRWGEGRKDTFGLKDTEADVEQHYVYVSTVVYF